jgi:hypothetical protein
MAPLKKQTSNNNNFRWAFVVAVALLTIFQAYWLYSVTTNQNVSSLAEISDIPSLETSLSPTKGTGASPLSLIELTTKGTGTSPLSLIELTNGHVREISCPPQLVPAYNMIVEPNSSAFGPCKIPRIMHFTMRRRCLPPDLFKTLQKWQAALPGHSIYFHDDEAVDKLMNQDWPEFPHLSKVFTCLKFGGAIKIDVWRALVLYKYGGIYSDIDNWPTKKFGEDTIRPDDEAFFLSDIWQRPSQWFQAMEPNHPIAYFTILEILTRVLAMPSLADIKPVFLTGPDALKHAYGHFLSWKTDIFETEGPHHGRFNKTARKIDRQNSDDSVRGHLGDTFHDIVAWNSKLNMTRMRRTEILNGVVHWPSKLLQTKSDREQFTDVPCWDYLYKMDNLGSTQTFLKLRAHIMEGLTKQREKSINKTLMIM